LSTRELVVVNKDLVAAYKYTHSAVKAMQLPVV
jgi:hypothetical protein